MQGKRLAVWICNLVVAILSVLSIICYFLGAFWQFRISVTITGDLITKMVGNVGDGIDVAEIVGEEGTTVSLSLTVETSDVLSSLTGEPSDTIESLIDKNVTSVVSQLKGTLMEIAESTVKSVAKKTVKDEVHKNVKDFLINNRKNQDDPQPEVGDEEVVQKMEELGITDDYIGEKTDKIIEKVFEDGSTVENVTDEIMDTVDEVLGDIKSKAEELSQSDESYEELKNFDLTQEEKDAIRENVTNALEELVQSEDGSIDAEKLIEELLASALNPDKGGNGKEDDKGELHAAVAPLAAAPTEGEDPGAEEQEQKLEQQVKEYIMNYLPEGIDNYLIWVFIAMAILMLLSALSWVYILIKLIVKLVKKSEDPTVKLKCPIWLGWLPYLFFVGIPSIALLFLPMITKLIPLPAEMSGMLSSMKLSISSIGVIAAISALVCFGISIFYMVVRRKFKQEKDGEGTSKREAVSEAEATEAEEAAVSSQD